MRAFLLGLALVVAAPIARATPMFMGLGYLPGDTTSAAAAVSADGSVVVGVSASPLTTAQAFRWTASGGMVGLGDLPGSEFDSRASGVSGDGAVVVGVGSPGPGPGVTDEAVYWTAASGMVGIGDLPGGETRSQANAVSADGSTIVGEGQSDAGPGHEAFVWTSSGGMVGLGGLPGVPIGSIAFDVSADGSIVVGSVIATPDEDDVAFLWTQSAGLVGLGTLPGGYSSEAQAVTPDGSIVVGSSSTGIDTYEAFRWTQSTGMVGLGNLPGGGGSEASSISADGSVIVGNGYGATQQGMAIIWFSGDSGPRVLKDVLVADFGLDLTGWTLLSAAVSSDGLTLVGDGQNPSGQGEAWIAFLPEPSVVPFLALGLTGIAASRRLVQARRKTEIGLEATGARRREGAGRLLSR